MKSTIRSFAFLTIISLFTITLYAGDPKSDSLKLDSFYRELTRKHFDAELRWVNEQTRKPVWYENTNLATLITAIGSLITAVFAIAALLAQRKWQLEKDKQTQRAEDDRQKGTREYESKRQKEFLDYQLERERQSHLYQALHWFEGKSQKRSIGIAIIEANWDSTKALHKTWTSILTNQAIYLLGASKQKDAAHEIANLNRIMALLEAHKDECSDLERTKLGEALNLKSKREGREPGLDLSAAENLAELKNWEKVFPKKG